ncbi:MAG: hypothetical protein DWC02_01935, partial [Candidatus Poseidoniales archaeon]
MQGDSEEFLSLEDEDTPPPKVKKSRRRTPKSETPTAEPTVLEAEVINMEVLGDYGGNHSICWPIQDMDCPDCASKA